MKQKMLVVSLCALALSACSSTGAIKTSNPEGIISGRVSRNVFEPSQVEVVLNGKSYRGPWRVEVPTAEQKAAVGYPHKSHLGLVNSVLVAEDGSKMTCHWKTHSYVAEGSCNADGREYPLNLK